MKTTVLGGIVALMAALLSPRMGQAQGTLYVSTLTQTPTGSAAVGSDSWLAEFFETGNNAGGYTLNSIQLGMADASGNPRGFAVMLYSEIGWPVGLAPGSSLGSLSGSSSPSAAGTYAYAATVNLTLSPNTFYFVVLTAGTTVADGAYNWSESAYPPSSGDGWRGGNGIIQSINGTSGWSPTPPYQGIGQLAISATAVPEPGVLSLVALGGLLLLRRRQKHVAGGRFAHGGD
jgi:hypothetical protein